MEERIESIVRILIATNQSKLEFRAEIAVKNGAQKFGACTISKIPCLVLLYSFFYLYQSHFLILHFRRATE